MNLFQDLERRGLVKQLTDPGLAKLIDQPGMTVYCGFDPTADSLHVGHLLPLVALRRFQLAGHKAIALMGGATGMIGDPSGKSQERSLLTTDTIEKNVSSIRKQVDRVLPQTHGAMVLNNADWFRKFSFLEFLRDVGKHFTVNHMIAKESVRARLEDREHGISYTEFSYMLLQAYDYYHLNESHQCRLQIGGSDQWGNITAGIELTRRMRAAKSQPVAEVYGLTFPLVSKSDGTKFGKTESGSIWLDPAKTSVYQFYQFFIQTADADVVNYLKYFTFLPHPELDRLEESVKKEPEKRLAQRTLAAEVTKLVHGESELARVEKATQALFGAEIRDLDERTLLDIFAGAPATKKPKAVLQAGYPVVDALVDSQLCSSKGAARKDLQAGGVYVNNERVADPAAVLATSQLIAGKFIVLRRGKKTYHLFSFD